MKFNLNISGFFRLGWARQTADLYTHDVALVDMLERDIALLGGSSRDIVRSNGSTITYWLNPQKVVPWLDKNADGRHYVLRETTQGRVLKEGVAREVPVENVVPFPRQDSVSDGQPEVRY